MIVSLAYSAKARPGNSEALRSNRGQSSTARFRQIGTVVTSTPQDDAERDLRRHGYAIDSHGYFCGKITIARRHFPLRFAARKRLVIARRGGRIAVYAVRLTAKASHGIK